MLCLLAFSPLNKPIIQLCEGDFRTCSNNESTSVKWQIFNLIRITGHILWDWLILSSTVFTVTTSHIFWSIVKQLSISLVRKLRIRDFCLLTFPSSAWPKADKFVPFCGCGWNHSQMLCIESVWEYECKHLMPAKCRHLLKLSERMAAAILWCKSLPNRITLINHSISFAVAVMNKQYWNLTKLMKLTENSEKDFCGLEKKDWGQR